MTKSTAPPTRLAGPTSTPRHKAIGSLAVIIRRTLATGLARLQDPQPEDFAARGLRSAKPGTSHLGLFPILALVSTLGVLLVSFSYDMAQYGDQVLEFLFLPGLLLTFVPSLVRLISPAPLRLERICLLCLVGMCFYLIQLMINPLSFTPYDAMLHWITADDILRTRHLFGENTLLPVSPYYPGLEIVTNALSSIGGLSTFQAGNFVIAAARFLMILSLYMFYEQVTMSSRMAGIATMIYMANPHFLFFDAVFSYETLALPIVTFMLYILARYDAMSNNYRWMLSLAWLSLIALTITHHMTDYVFDGFLALWTIASLLQISGRRMRRPLAALALSGLLLSLAYAFFMTGNPVWEYLSSYFATAFKELGSIVEGSGTARQLFSGQGAPSSPLWDRLLMMGAVALTMLGLPFGLLSLWRQHRHSVLAIVLGFAVLAYPVTQVFRFTNYGGEIADRSAAFLFIAIAYVLTIFITHYWPTRHLNWRVTTLIACALSVMLLGNTLLEVGRAYSGLPGPYAVIADGRSIEPIGIQAAEWSLSHLGPDNRVATDRINQTLFGTFGNQHIVTETEINMGLASVFYSSHLDHEAVAILRNAGIRYLVVDLRLSTSLPVMGFYFEPDEPGAFHLTHPISREALTKFSAVPQINEVFDDGSIVIYDVGAFTNEASHGYALAIPSI